MGVGKVLAGVICLVGFMGFSGGVCLAAETDASGCTLYVDQVNGSDENNGESLEQAFQTLEKARDTVRGMEQTADITVCVHGTYRLAVPFTLTQDDSGKNGHRITYKGLEGDKPAVLTGAVPIEGWELYDEAGGIYRAQTGMDHYTRDLFVNGQKAVRAREVNPDGFQMDASCGFICPKSGRFSEMGAWGNIPDIEISQLVKWTNQKGTVAQIRDGKIYMKQPFWDSTRRLAQWGIGMTEPAVIENAYELLDEPGEWYLQRDTGYLYYIPKDGEDMESLCVEMPILEHLIEARGDIEQPVQNLVFEGITFTGTTNLAPLRAEGWPDHQAGVCEHLGSNGESYDEKGTAALEFDWAHGVTVRACTFTNLGNGGIAFDLGSRENLITQNTLTGIGGNGIMIGDINWGGSGLNEIGQSDHHPEDERCVVRDNTVSYNHITRIGEDLTSAVGIMVGYTYGTVIDHNTLEDLPYTAISLGWGWGSSEEGNVRTDLTGYNQVTYNRIANYMKTNLDGGGIYTLGQQEGSVIRYNYLSGQDNEYAYIYLDNGTEDYLVEYNVISSEEGGRGTHWYMSNNMGGASEIQTFRNMCRFNYYSSGLSVFNNSPYCTVGGNKELIPGQWPEYALEIASNAGIEGLTNSEPPDFTDNFALCQTAFSSNCYQNNQLYAAERAVDGDENTRWASDEGQEYWWLQVDFTKERTFNRVVIDEGSYKGRIRDYTIQYWDGNGWISLYREQTQNASKTIAVETVSTSKIRLWIDEAAVGPTISEFAVYYQEPEELLSENDFEDNIGSWMKLGSVKLNTDRLNPFAGECCLIISERSAEWHGTQQKIKDQLEQKGKGTYHLKAYVKLSEGSGHAKVQLNLIDQDGAHYPTVTGEVSSQGWTLIEGDVEADWTGRLQDGYFAVNTVDVIDADLYLDQCSVQRVP
ncbi:discoidin domain-containing protein [Diplocloster agilis]|uniref:discoidin domain-containing protein n=1 Tax=Diplocloster agilis TaxID=2850323 RepID=UPI000822A678|nr:discoidin domain-containing protein [Suonthocola fibrivorans]MCU6732919.1 discoidin domain-containing protein [Suonthocola fibrivorans]SCI66934.1 F5/8 type C domain [uncultured Clostridium sp.]